MASSYPQLARLAGVMHTLRARCPWDAEQTHLSLINYLVEETCEAVEAIESGDDAAILEELGDVLLQVFFHAEIASETNRFDINDVAKHIADKLIARHPWVFEHEKPPDDLISAWELQKAKEKARTAVTDGIPSKLSALSRAAKVLGRAESLGQPTDVVPAKVRPDRIGAELLRLVAAAQAAGLDPEQEAREALRQVEARLAGHTRP